MTRAEPSQKGDTKVALRKKHSNCFKKKQQEKIKTVEKSKTPLATERGSEQ